jgi:hypothetical protein
MNEARDRASLDLRLPNHGGDPLPRNADFFVEPPDEIGEIKSAHTTLRHGQAPWALAPRLLLAGGIALAVALGAFALLHAAKARNLAWLVLLPGGVGLLALAVVMHLTRFVHSCTYVGKEGVARFKCAGRRDQLSRGEAFLFRTAADLRTSQVRRFVNGAYQGTDYTFSWTDRHGRTCFQVRGTHKAREGSPPSDHPYHFGSAAELAWTLYLLDEVSEELKRTGWVDFSLGSNDGIRLGPGKLALSLKGEHAELDVSDIAEISMAQGVVSITRVGARKGWFSSRGVYTFNYNALSNGQLFLFLLEKLVGIQVR